MKKFYSIVAVAALSCTVAFAATRQQAATFTLKTAKAALTENVSKNIAVAPKFAKAPAKAAAMADLAGAYDWAFENLLEGAEPSPELVITIDDEATGAATISGFPQNYSVSATIDLTAGTVTIPNNQNLGPDSFGDTNYFYLKAFNAAGTALVDGATSAASTVGTINGTTITFPADEIWAIGDPDAEDLGWWSMTCENELTKQAPREEFGGATVSGDMFFTGFGKTPADYQVTVYRSEDKNTYTVKNPLKGLYTAVGWTTSESPDMVMDASDPDNVVIPLFSTGINGGATDGLYYGLSDSFINEDPADTEEELRITLTTDGSDMVFNIPTKAMYLYASTSKKVYYGNNQPITITIPNAAAGINGVEAEATNVAPVYYNLQGVRVAQPQNGLFIEVRGNKAVKVIK